MDDQRVEARPVLGREDAGHRPVVGGVGAQAVDGLGREGDQAAGAQQLARGGVGRAVRWQDPWCLFDRHVEVIKGRRGVEKTKLDQANAKPRAPKGAAAHLLS